MFRRRPDDPFPVGSANGSKHFVMPDDALILAAADGLVWSAGLTPRGYAIVLDHGPRHPAGPVATFYTHAAKLFVAPTQRGRRSQRVRAGQPLGIVGGDPKDPRQLKHLHFEIWRGGPAHALDPLPHLKQWPIAPLPLVGPLLTAGTTP